MIKIVILGCFVAWMFIRSLSKSKPNAIWRIKLKRLTFFFMVGAITWLITISLGPSKYQVYTDKIIQYRGNTPAVFAWEENRILPTRRFATPVLLSLDFETVYAVEESKLESWVKAYPYDRYHIGIRQFMGSFLFFILAFVYLSRHRHTDRRWQEAVESDSKIQYWNFISWANSNLIRKVHTRALRKKAKESVQSIDQRGKLKLEMYRRGWQARGLQSQFLDIIDQVLRSGHDNVVVSAKHMELNPEVESKLTAGQIIARWSALHPQRFMKAFHELTVEEAQSKSEPSEFDRYALSCPEHFQFTYPVHEEMNQSLETTFVNVFNQGKKRFLGDDILSFTESSNGFLDDAPVKLELSYNCMLRSTSGKRTASVWARTINHNKVTMGDTSYPGGSLMWPVFGLQVNWKLLIEGREAAAGLYQAFPDSNICNAGVPNKASMPPKKEIERNLFEVVSLSNVSALFAQMMGLPVDKINGRMLELSATTALEAKRQKEASSNLSDMLEDALRGEALEELLLTSAEELYKQNREMVDAVVRDYITTHGDTDTVLMIVDLLGDAAPELAAYFLQQLGGTDE